MNKSGFARIALTIGLVIALALLAAGATNPASEPALPLLTLLILCEFGFIVTVIGAFLAVRSLLARGITARSGSEALGCIVLAAAFLMLGLALWPQGGLG
jgi:hypothetical protein